MKSTQPLWSRSSLGRFPTLDTDLHTESNLLEVYIARLRRKLGAGGATDLITTIRGAGYRLESDGSCVPSSGAPASA